VEYFRGEKMINVNPVFNTLEEAEIEKAHCERLIDPDSQDGERAEIEEVED